MTPKLWAGTDPADDVARTPDLAASTGARATPDTPAVVPATLADLDGAVRSIGAHALKMNLARTGNLSEALTLAAGGQLDEARRTSAVDAAHQLVGSAGTFGFPGASDRAAELERFFVRAVFDDTHLSTARAQLDSLFAELATEPDY